MIYLNAAATTLQKPPQVAAAVLAAMRSFSSFGRGGSAAESRAEDAVYRCRCAAASLFDAAPAQVVFTMNATHALNLAVHTLVRPGDEVVISGFEHNAVWRPLTAAGANLRIAGRKLFDPDDTLSAFDAAITARIKAVFCTHVSNVFGYILPVEQIAALCRARGVPFVLDASQSAGSLPVSLRALGAAFIAMPGHKGLYGPQGTGILLCGMRPEPLISGGTGSLSRLPVMPEQLPDRAEAGTLNVPGIHGLAAGLEFVQNTGIEAILRHEQALQEQMCRALEGSGVDVFAGTAQTGVLSVQKRGVDCETLAQALADEGIAVRAGLHCAPLAHESAGTLEQGTVRLSFSYFNTPEEIERCAAVLKK